MTKSYRIFLKLLEQWSVDSTKVGRFKKVKARRESWPACGGVYPVFLNFGTKYRDLGQHIREQVKTAFKAGEVYPWDENECNRIHASLKRLADNRYGQMYPRSSKSSASGLSADECHAVLSNEFLEELKKSEQGFFSKLFYTKT